MRADAKPLHPLLALARIADENAVEACFHIVEAMSRECSEPDMACGLYRRAFRLWPELDSDQGPDGVPIKLRAAADVVNAEDGVCTSWVVAPDDWQPLPRGPSFPLVQEFRRRMLDSFDLAGVAKYIIERKANRIVVLCGAGISTSAGIPDFRSPGSGLYTRLEKYSLPKPEAMFSLDYFRSNPAPFCELAMELWPGSFNPTPCHHFIRLLYDKGLLQRCYTQNIDSLELLAGLPAELLVQAHGSFQAAHVIDTDPEMAVDARELRDALQAGESRWRALCERSGGLVKPKITFFGEALPLRFTELHRADMAACDLLVILGTSLAVAPCNGLVAKVGVDVPRLLVNRDDVGRCEWMFGGLRHHLEDGSNHRDVFHACEIDAGVQALAAHLGWASDLETLVVGSS